MNVEEKLIKLLLYFLRCIFEEFVEIKEEYFNENKICRKKI